MEIDLVYGLGALARVLGSVALSVGADRPSSVFAAKSTGSGLISRMVRLYLMPLDRPRPRRDRRALLKPLVRPPPSCPASVLAKTATLLQAPRPARLGSRSPTQPVTERRGRERLGGTRHSSHGAKGEDKLGRVLQQSMTHADKPYAQLGTTPGLSESSSFVVGFAMGPVLSHAGRLPGANFLRRPGTNTNTNNPYYGSLPFVRKPPSPPKHTFPETWDLRHETLQGGSRLFSFRSRHQPSPIEPCWSPQSWHRSRHAGGTKNKKKE